SGLPLMVHIGDTTKRYDANVIRQLLPILEPGDIVTHLFTANPGGVLDGAGRLVPEAKELAGRGVWLDTAHGRMNFGFNVGRKVLDQGLIPHCISTDLTIPGRLNTVHSMVEIMARFLGMGFTLEQVIAASTINPARAIGEDARIGSLAVGRQADISVLEIREGRWVVYDTVRDSMKIDKAVVPVLTVKRGRVFEPEWGPHPVGVGPGAGPHMMQFGLMLRAQFPQGDDMQARFQEQLEQARLADALGFASITKGMHYSSAPLQSLQQLPFLSRVMAEAPNLRVNFGLILLSLHKPLDVAEQIATVDVMSGGKVIFGVALGYREVEFLAFGTTQKERVKRF